MPDIEKFAEEYGLDEQTLKSFTNYFVGKLKESKERMDWFFKDPNTVIEQGLQGWLESSRAFYAKMQDPNSEEYKMLVIELEKKSQATLPN